MWIFVGIIGAIWSFCWSLSARLHRYNDFPLEKTADGSLFARVKVKSDYVGILVPGKHSAKVRFRRERPRDVWAKRIGLADEISVGEARFDSTVYVESDSPAIQFALAQDSKLRAALLELLVPPFYRVEVLDGFVVAQCRRITLGESTIDDEIESKAVPLLHVVNQSMTEIESRVDACGIDPALRRSRWVTMCSWTMLLVGFLLETQDPPFGPVLDNVPLWRWSFISGCFVAAVFAMFFLSVIGRSSVRHLVLFDFLSVGLIGTILLTYYTAKSLNQNTDTASPETIAATVDHVERRWYSRRRGRGRWIYSMHVSALYGAGASTANLTIPTGMYSSIRRGDRLLIDIQPGQLGARWISSISCVLPSGKTLGPWSGSTLGMRHPTLIRRLYNALT